jgi:hypothetical protein
MNIRGNAWRQEVINAVNRTSRGEGSISFLLDRLPGAEGGLDGILATARDTVANGGPVQATQWELLQIADAGMLNKVQFYMTDLNKKTWSPL